MDISSSPESATAFALPPSRQAEIKAVSQELEAAFLTHMLTLAGVGKAPSGFNGGAGENQFSSFLVTEYANKITDAGGLGLAEHIYNSMVAAEEHTP